MTRASQHGFRHCSTAEAPDPRRGESARRQIDARGFTFCSVEVPRLIRGPSGPALPADPAAMGASALLSLSASLEIHDALTRCCYAVVRTGLARTSDGVCRRRSARRRRDRWHSQWDGRSHSLSPACTDEYPPLTTDDGDNPPRYSRGFDSDGAMHMSEGHPPLRVAPYHKIA